MPSNMMNIEIRIRNMPFAKPESVSILPKLIIDFKISAGTIGSNSPVGKPLVGRPSRHDRCEETYANSHTIKAHMDGYRLAN